MKKRDKGLVLSYVYFGLNAILNVVITAFIVRKIGQTDFGVYQTIAAFAAYLLLLEFGTGALMNRDISILRKEGEKSLNLKKHISTIWTLTIILAIAIIGFSIVFYFLIPSIYHNSLNAEQIGLAKTLFVYVSINLVFNFLTQTLDGVILAFENYLFEKLISLAKLVFRSLTILLVISIESNIFYVVLIDSIISILVFVCTVLFCFRKCHVILDFKYFDKRVFTGIIPFCLAMLLQTVVNTANGSLDKFLISIMMTPDDVSVYAISMTFFSMFSSIACIPSAMFMPQIAKKMNEGLDMNDLTKMLIKPSRFNALILGILAFGILVSGKPFIIIVFGEDYADSWLYAIIIILPMLFASFNGVIINVIDILNKRHIRSLILFLTTVCNLICTIFGIRYFGMVGAATSTALSIVIQTIILNIYYKKKLGIDSFRIFKESFKGLLLCLLLSAIVSLPLQYLISNLYLQFLVTGLAFVGLFVIFFFAFGTTEEEKALFNNFLNKGNNRNKER